MNTNYRKPLPNVSVAGAPVDFFDTRQAVEEIQPGAYAQLPYTSRVLAEQLVRRCDPALLTDALKQLIERKQELDFPGTRPGWFATTSRARPRWSTRPGCATPSRRRAVTLPR